MFFYTFNILTSIFFPLLIIFATFVMSWSSLMDREKSSPYECGFDPKNSARLPFSLRFFLLAVIFLVFDIEIALLMPIPLFLNKNFPFMVLLGSLIFFIILLLGLLHEWREGSLDWSN
uniref:NADH dehydrogenase subunit 3 n=1 Tax=Loimia medusa TaxID=167822 RepID=UPI0031F3D6E1